MKKLLGIVSLAALALGAFAETPKPLQSFVDKLSSSDSVSAKYTVTATDGSSDSYTVVLAKSGMARIETPERVLTSDGDTITVLIRKTGQYFKKPYSKDEISKMLKGDALIIWASFLENTALTSKTATAKAAVKRKGKDMTPVDVVLDGKGKVLTLLFEKTKGDLGQATLAVKSAKGTNTRVIDLESLKFGDVVSADTVAMKLPGNAKEISEEDLIASTWYTSLDEALEVAAATDRPILVDFFATWCGPCKMLDAQVFSTSSFKDFSKGFVLCRIDVDEQPDIAQKFNIEAMPTTIVLNSSGSELGRFLGFMPAAEYISEVKKISGK